MNDNKRPVSQYSGESEAQLHGTQDDPKSTPSICIALKNGSGYPFL